jgi:hypothetical protein
MEVNGIPADLITRATAIHHFFDRFTDGGHVTVETLIDDVKNRDRQCWIIRDKEIRAMALTRIAAGEYPICEITHVSGKGLREWHSAYLEIEKWARAQGCKRIKALARPGYERIGARYGLRKTHVLLEVDL